MYHHLNPKIVLTDSRFSGDSDSTLDKVKTYAKDQIDLIGQIPRVVRLAPVAAILVVGGSIAIGYYIGKKK